MRILSVITLGALLAQVEVSQVVRNPSGEWLDDATSSDQTVAEAAQIHLRDMGPQGLELLKQRFASEITAHRNHAAADAHWRRIAQALDAAGSQYDNYASGLYWYTDIEKAKAAALATGRPILSLRLLGRLDENLSCANSRFFRTTVYPDAEVNTLLKGRFILHWQSVRPVPVITISFGDGRTLRRTVTGNSIHYVLDQRGNVVDALPGLYSGRVFAAELRLAADAVSQMHGAYRTHISDTRMRLLRAWAADLGAVGVPLNGNALPDELEQSTDDKAWRKIAQLRLGEAVATREFPTAQAATRLTASKAAVENPMLRMLANLGQTVGLDTVRNNYLLRTKILAFLSAPGVLSFPPDRINDWVYRQVFLTPREDPWLGLAPPDVYAAVDEDGKPR